MRALLHRLPFMLLAVATLVLGPASPGRAKGRVASAFPDSLQERWTRYQRTGHAPGLAVVLVRDTGVVAMATLGERDLERHLPVTPDTRFYIASCTKTFVATALWTLAHEGALDLDAPVRRSLPGFLLADAGATESLSVRDLLTHRRGLNHRAIGLLTAYTGQMTDERWRWWLAQVKPRNRFAYSNLHYLIAGRVLESLTGRTWPRAVEARVTRPLGMTRMALDSRALTHDPDMARPYEFERGAFVARSPKSDRTLHAAGGLGASAGDLARWLRAHLGDGRIDGAQALPVAVVRGLRRLEVSIDDAHPLLPAQKRVGWTAGWEVRTVNGDTMYVHTGSYLGAAAHFSYVPSRGAGVAVLANANLPPLTELVAGEVYDWAAGLASPDLSERLGQLAARMSAPPATDTLPARPTHAGRGYHGHFTDAHWGDLVVTRRGPDVAMRLGEYPMSLRWEGPDAFVADGDTPGRFERDARDRVTAVWLRFGAQDSTRFVKK